MKDPVIDKYLKRIQQKFVNSMRNIFASRSKDTNPDEKHTVIETLKHKDITWIDITNPKKKTIADLSTEYPFHPLHLEACLEGDQLDRLEVEDDYLFILLHNPMYKPETDKIVTNKMYVFLGKNYVITLHDDTVKTVSSLFKKCEDTPEIKDEFFKKSSAYLLYSILEELVNTMAVLRKIVLQELDEIDDLVFDTKVSGVYEISTLRQRIVRLRRVLGPYRKILQSLAADSSKFTLNMTRYFKNIANEADRLWDTLEEARETIEIYKDADFTVSTEKTNKILTVLTVIFTFTIPTTIFGTLYGMNIFLPGGIEAGSWLFLGEFTTFYIIVAASFISIILMLLYFKYKDWL